MDKTKTLFNLRRHKAESYGSFDRCANESSLLCCSSSDAKPFNRATAKVEETKFKKPHEWVHFLTCLMIEALIGDAEAVCNKENLASGPGLVDATTTGNLR